jgi:DNA replication protein DnaC
MNRVTLSPELSQVLRRLRLGQIIEGLAERLELAQRDDTPIQDVLLMILSDEINRRDGTALDRRVEAADLDPDRVFERWDPDAKIIYDRKVLAELRTLRFIHARRNVSILGPVGVGKTFVASALGHLACRAQMQVHFERADEMLRRLKQSRYDNSRDRLMLELSTVDLLIIDDFALEAMSSDESRDVYQLIVERHTRFSTIVTSNRDTAEWISLFSDQLLAQSAVDRFKNSAYDLVIDGESYRDRQKPQVGELASGAMTNSSAPKAKRKRRLARRFK